MILYIDNKDVRTLVSVQDANAVVEEGFKQWKRDGTVNMPRRRLPLPGGKVLNHMVAALPSADAFGFKAYFSLPQGRSQLVFLYSISEGRFLCMIEARDLGQLRTGAASAVATRYLARENAKTVALIGTGSHGLPQLQAVSAVRSFSRGQVFSRNPDNCQRFARAASAALGFEVVAATSAEAAVDGADVIVTATNGRQPVLLGRWLKPGVHINAMGANAASQRELDDAAVLKCDRVVVDDVEQAKIESGELIGLAQAGKIEWESLVELGDVVRGTAPRRGSPSEITLFNSLGLALEDVAIGRLIYDRAVAQGLGKKLDFP